jgi:hypothetical protein
VAVATAIPLVACVLIVLLWGDEFGDAVTYHTSRGLQVESLAATPFEVAGLFGADVSSGVASGGFDVFAGGTTVAKWISVVVGAGLYMLMLWAGWRSSADRLAWATALLAVLVVFAPVLSPQFLLWVLPLSAAAFGLGKENAVLLIAVLLTQITLQNYDQVDGLGAGFVWPVAGKNLYLLVYVVLVCGPILRAWLSGPEPWPGWLTRRPDAARAAISGPKNQGM